MFLHKFNDITLVYIYTYNYFYLFLCLKENIYCEILICKLFIVIFIK